MGRNGQLLLRGRRGAGRQPRRRCAATPARCVQCSSCPNGCRLDAKRAMHVSYLPRAVAAGARVRAGVEARRVVFERRARRSAVDVPGRGRRAQRRAGAAVHGPRPRAVWSSPAAPSGRPSCCCARAFARRAAQLGRNLRIHPACWVGARFEEEVRGWEGVMQSYAVDEWEERGHPARGDLHPARLRRPVAARAPGPSTASGCSLTTTSPRRASTSPTSSAGRVGLGRDGSLRITYRLTATTRDRLVFGIARAAELFYAAGATRGLSADLGHADASPRRGSPSSRPLPRAARRCGSRPFTRWARRAWTPTRAAA